MQILQSHITATVELESVQSVCTTPLTLSLFTLSLTLSLFILSFPFFPPIFCSIISHFESFDSSQPFVCLFLTPILNKRFFVFPAGLISFCSKACCSQSFLTVALKKRSVTPQFVGHCSKNSITCCHKHDSPHLVICSRFTLPKRPSISCRHNHSAV